MIEEALLETLIIRPPSRPPIRPEKDFIEVKMTNLDYLSEVIEEDEPMIVEYVDDRPSLD